MASGVKERMGLTGIPGVPVDPRALVPCLLLGYAKFLARYHRHRIHHLDRLDRVLCEGRRVVLVGNHVLDLADPLLFVAALVRRCQRAPHFIGHENIIFHVPGLRELATGWGVIPSRHIEEAGDALERDGLLMLFPGAATEAAMRRFRDEPYRLSARARAGGIPGARPTCRYHGAPLTFGLLGPHLLPAAFPLPVQLTHDVSPPLDLGDREAARRDPSALDALHARVWAECQAFLDAAVARRARGAPCTDRLVRGVERVLEAAGV